MDGRDNWLIVPESNPAFCIQVQQGGRRGDGALLEIAYRAPAGARCQFFEIYPEHRCYLCAQSGLVMDIGKDDSRGKNIIQWRWRGGHNLNQQWQYDRNTGLLKSMDEGLVLDVLGGVLRPGATLVGAPRSGSASQRWIILSATNPNIRYPVVQDQRPAFIPANDSWPESVTRGNQELEMANQQPAFIDPDFEG
jgi:hypothetical protein